MNINLILSSLTLILFFSRFDCQSNDQPFRDRLRVSQELSSESLDLLVDNTRSYSFIPVGNDLLIVSYITQILKLILHKEIRRLTNELLVHSVNFTLHIVSLFVYIKVNLKSYFAPNVQSINCKINED
jgi:hypothetical protein